jgi:hypothetical protein
MDVKLIDGPLDGLRASVKHSRTTVVIPSDQAPEGYALRYRNRYGEDRDQFRYDGIVELVTRVAPTEPTPVEILDAAWERAAAARNALYNVMVDQGEGRVEVVLSRLGSGAVRKAFAELDSLPSLLTELRRYVANPR